jgi:hypothetical protein
MLSSLIYASREVTRYTNLDTTGDMQTARSHIGLCIYATSQGDEASLAVLLPWTDVHILGGLSIQRSISKSLHIPQRCLSMSFYSGKG